MVNTIPFMTDLAIQAENGSLLALVEIKNLPELSPEIAAELRRDIHAHRLANRDAPFFLIVSQDTGYLWDERSLPPGDAPLPTASFPMAPVVAHYLPSFVGRGRLAESELELAVIQWLWDLAYGIEDRPKDPETALAHTDFVRLIRGGRVITETDR